MPIQMKTLLIDNHDSFTYNLAHLLTQVNQQEPIIIPNDQFEWSEVCNWEFDNIVISPGPGHPANVDDFHISAQAIAQARQPLLGICLGYQGLALAYGGKVVHRPKPIHGFASIIKHSGTEIFKGMESPFSVGRYHSFMVSRPLPPELREIATTEEGELIAIAHREKPQWGVQFHPESILSEKGQELIANFRDLTVEYNQKNLGFHLADTLLHHGNTHQMVIPPKPSKLFHYWKEIPIEVDTEKVFTTYFASSKNAFWLDSNMHEKGLGNWSYLGASSEQSTQMISYKTNTKELSIFDGRETHVEQQSIFSFLENQMKEKIASDHSPPCPFLGGYVGWFGYEMRNECGFPTQRQSNLPDAVLLKVDHFIAVDHRHSRTYVIAVSENEISHLSKKWVNEMCLSIENLSPVETKPTHSFTAEYTAPAFYMNKEKYLRAIEQALHWIRQGETYQLCLTNELTIDCPTTPLALYQELRSINAAPYAAFFKWSGGSILSTSPEGFLDVDQDRNVLTRPMKGTLRRSQDALEDQELANQLQSSSKNLAENMMIVDLLRNDLSQVCEPGSVIVEKPCEVHHLTNLHTLVSTIQGKLQRGKSAIDLLKATFPGGSITGVPKERTLGLIDQLEQRARGAYTGTLGWFGYDGCMDLSILIRTIVETAGRLSIGVGGGIVTDSIAEEEYAEILLKSRAVLHAIEQSAMNQNPTDTFEGQR